MDQELVARHRGLASTEDIRTMDEAISRLLDDRLFWWVPHDLSDDKAPKKNTRSQSYLAEKQKLILGGTSVRHRGTRSLHDTSVLDSSNRMKTTSLMSSNHGFRGAQNAPPPQ